MRKKCDFTKSRGEDLLRAYHKCVREHSEITSQYEMIKETVNSPASKFWINAENASKLLQEMLNGKSTLNWRNERFEMISEISRRYYCMKNTEKFKNYSTIHLVTIICEQPAPRFYLEVDTAMKLFWKSIREKQDIRKEKYSYL